MTKSGFPMNTLLEQVYRRPVRMELGTDNETCELAINTGYSKGMRHLRKHQRLSIGLYNEACDRDDVDVAYLESGENTTNVLTRAF